MVQWDLKKREILNLPFSHSAGDSDLVSEMKYQAEWVIDCQLDKLSKHLLSGFPVHTYYQITSGWRSVIFHTNHLDRADNWDN